ncbi:MAG TPA: RNA polymerase sigma factor [Baekduia sp.]|uniref:RNA polymerase sigma factor n=1 Tax=Baekduia sp. TaxID=2600305 RepID=UPI002D7A20A3|nr:RNA polymerase sigma factor [Baekduia sp.]HET6507761.1 RNA polymerase sigma factor [Baekduia sp.]
MFRFLVASVGREAADDCFQETFLAALKAWPKLRAGSNERAWVMTIAHRKAMDHHRARARRPVPVEEVPEVAVHDAPLADDETWARVRALPPKMKAAVLLRYAGDLTHAEVAVALSCSEEAARRSAHEGLKRLRAQMSPT